MPAGRSAPPAPRVRLVDSVPADADTLAVAIRGAPDSPSAVLADGAAADLRSWAPDVAVTAVGVLTRAKATGRAGEVHAVPVGERQVYLLGVGDGGPRDLRRAGAALARSARHARLLAVTAVRRADAAGLRAFTEGVLLGGYSYRAAGGVKPMTPEAGRVNIVTAPRRGASSQAAAVGAVRRFGRRSPPAPSPRRRPAWPGT